MLLVCKTSTVLRVIPKCVVLTILKGILLQPLPWGGWQLPYDGLPPCGLLEEELQAVGRNVCQLASQLLLLLSAQRQELAQGAAEGDEAG